MSDEGNYIILYTYCSILAMVTVFLLRCCIWRKKCLGKRDKHADNLLCLNIYYSKPLNYFCQTLFTALQFSFIEQLSYARQFIRPWGTRNYRLSDSEPCRKDKCIQVNHRVMNAMVQTVRVLWELKRLPKPEVCSLRVSKLLGREYF